MNRIVFMGTPDFSIPTLRQLIASNYDLVAVYTQPDKPAGRGRKLAFSPVRELAKASGIPVYQPTTFKHLEELNRLEGLSPDAIVVVAYGQILPDKILSIPAFGCLNIHPSLLPQYRGPSPIPSAILANEERTGVTIMLLDAGMDTGPILSQQSVTILPDDTTQSLEKRLSEMGAELLLRVLPQWLEQKLTPQRQDNSRATYTRQITRKDGELNWEMSADELNRHIRAYFPWPGCYTRWRNQVLKIRKSVLLPGMDDVEPGLVIKLPAEMSVPIGVGTGKGVLGLSWVQLEGKKSMSISDFVRGQNQFVGQILG